MAKYFDRSALPVPPALTTWAKKVSAWGAMLNLSLGCCGIAGAGHGIQSLSANANTEIILPDAAILTGYEAVGGYNPAVPSTDGGIVLLDGLNYWKNIGYGGHQISSYVKLTSGDQYQVECAIALMGGVYTGVALPLTAQTQTVWDVVGFGLFGKAIPNSWGGHCVWAVDFNATGPIVISWGEVIQTTWAFWMKYVDEAYGVNSPDWFSAAMVTPSGLDVQHMNDDALLLAA